jgi:hypothetical protein
MGKRELLLIVAFAIVGAIVYQVTAPPPGPGERGFSPGQILENIRRGVRGNRASAESVNNSTHPVDAAVTELRLTSRGRPAELTIVGETRADITAELRVHSNAYDDAEAERTAKTTVLRVERQGSRVAAYVDYPPEGRQTATLTLRVPARLQITIQGMRNRLHVTNVAAIEFEDGRGTTEFRQIAGRVAGSYRGGELRITGAKSVKVDGVGTDLTLEQIAGEASLKLRAGDFKGSGLAGPIDIDSTGVDVELENLEKNTSMIRITAAAGSVSLKGLRTEARIDARGTDVDAVLDRAAPLAVYSEGGSPVEITPPPGGYQLDAVASDGSITVPEGTVPITTSGEEHRATGPVKGGGPTITIRAAHGNITLRERE